MVFKFFLSYIKCTDKTIVNACNAHKSTIGDLWHDLICYCVCSTTFFSKAAMHIFFVVVEDFKKQQVKTCKVISKVSITYMPNLTMKNLRLITFLFALVKMKKWVEKCNDDVDLMEVKSLWHLWIYSNKHIRNVLRLKK